MSEIGKTYAQWDNAIKKEIFTTVRGIRNIFIHKSKLTFINDQINDFYKILLKKETSNEIVTEEDTKKYEELIKTLKKYTELYRQLTKQNYFEYITTNPIDIVNKLIVEFQNNFNSAAISLNLASTPPISQIFRPVDERNDCEALINVIMPSGTKEIVQTMVHQLKKRIDEIDGGVNGSEIERFLSDLEISDIIEDFANIVLTTADFQSHKKIVAKSSFTLRQGVFSKFMVPCIIKEFNSERFTRKQAEEFKEEIIIASKLNHFMFPKLVGITNVAPYCIIGKSATGDPLSSQMKALKAFNSTEQTIIALGVAYAMAYLHSENMMHRNLTLSRIILDQENMPHLIDAETIAVIPESGMFTEPIGSKEDMAPEMLSGKGYTKKADVFNYGVILYELLTRKAPKITNSHGPEMPSGCNSKLSNLITSCLSLNPEKRPTFANIVEQFESGAVTFNDANLDAVQIYREKFMSAIDQQINKFDSQTVNKEKLDDIFNSLELKDEKSRIKAISITKDVINNESWNDIIIKSDIVTRIQKIMETCKSAKVAYALIELASDLYKMEYFKEAVNGATTTVAKHTLDIIKRFGEKPNFYPFISLMCTTTKGEVDKPIFDDTQTKYIGTFFTTQNREAQNNAFYLYDYIVRNKLYSKVYALLPPIQPMFNSYFRKVRNIDVVSLFNVLAKVDKEILYEMCRIDAQVVLFPMIIDKSLAKETMKSLLVLCSLHTPPQAFAQLVTTNFSKIVETFTDEKIRPLLLFSTILFIQTTYTKLIETPSTVKCFDDYLNDEDDKLKILTLKICFVLLENETSSKAIHAIVPSIKRLLNYKKRDISLLAASCLILVIAQLPETYNTDKEICDFIAKSLNGDSEEKKIGIKLIGVMAQKKEGAVAIQESGLIPPLCKLVFSSDRTMRYFALAAITVISSTLKYTEEMADIVDIFINLPLEDMAYQLIHSFVANVSTDSKGAVILAKYIPKLIENATVSNQKSTIVYLITIQNIFNCKEAADIVKKHSDLKTMNKLFPLISKGFDSYVLNIYNAAIDIPEVKDIIGTKELLKISKTMKKTIVAESHLKSVLTHIIEVLSE